MVKTIGESVPCKSPLHAWHHFIYKRNARTNRRHFKLHLRIEKMLEIMVFLLEMIKAFFLTQDNEETKEKRNGKSFITKLGNCSFKRLNVKGMFFQIIYTKLFLRRSFYHNETYRIYYFIMLKSLKLLIPCLRNIKNIKANC